MIIYTEANSIKTASNNVLLSWMYVNLKNTGSDKDTAGSSTYGYWVSADASADTSGVRFIRYN